tara:strand:- start:124 stop:501 length:378 start_codon:yes stop_codon:yes gene_type:complete
MNVPDNIKYTKEHEWCKIEEDVAIIGITDFAQSELGDIVFVEFPEINNFVNKDETVGTIEAVKTVADIYSPLSGDVIDINNNLDSEPNLINDDPYNGGWIYKIKLSDLDEINSLLSSNSYKDLIK